MLQGTIKCEAPCYEVHKVPVAVTNPYPKAGEFKVILVENQLGQLTEAGKSMAPASRKPVKKVSSKNLRKASPELSMEGEESDFLANTSNRTQGNDDTNTFIHRTVYAV